MLETLRKYWIALLLLLMIGIHASIVGLIRYQASLAKQDASCEVDLGNYLAYHPSRQAPLSLRVHALVPASHRLTSRMLLEQNRIQIRQALEERLRQIDPALLTDPFLSDLKNHLYDVLAQMTGGTAVEEVLITEVQEAKEIGNLAFRSVSSTNRPIPVVSTLRRSHNSDSAEDSDEAGHAATDEQHGTNDHGDQAATHP